jgi:hypothetical protein
VREAIGRALNGLPPPGHTLDDEPAIQEAVDRTFTCCIGALQSTLTAIKSDAAAAAEALAQVLPNEKAWKALFTNRSGGARRSAYSFVGYLAQQTPSLVDGIAGVLGPLVLGAIGDNDQTTHPAMWECVLAWLRIHPDAWALVNVKKVVLPRLWAMLRVSCFGSFATSYQCLLPLLSLIPPEIASSMDFLDNFFGALWHGIVHTPHVGTQQGVISAAVPAMMECTLFAISSAADPTIEAHLISPIIESAIIALLRDKRIASNTQAGTAIIETIGKIKTLPVSHLRAAIGLLDIAIPLTKSFLANTPYVPCTTAGLLEVNATEEIDP